MADPLDAWVDDIERLLAIGIAVTEGHSFAAIGPGHMVPGPNTMRVAREVLRRHKEEVDRG